MCNRKIDSVELYRILLCKNNPILCLKLPALLLLWYLLFYIFLFYFVETVAFSKLVESVEKRGGSDTYGMVLCIYRVVLAICRHCDLNQKYSPVHSAVLLASESVLQSAKSKVIKLH